ncbi:MAG: ATPase domain-containing protein [Candidatus Thermoplasmatota archaeon]
MGIKRVITGVKGMDKLIEGGFVVPSTTLLLGEPGTGKTTFGLQFLFEGAKRGERGLYVTGLSEPERVVRSLISAFSFYDEELIKTGKIVLHDYGQSLSTFIPEKALAEIANIIGRIKPHRFVLDPLPPAYLFSAPIEYQRYLYRTLSKLKELDTVAIFIGEHTVRVPTGMEGYMVDGIIQLAFSSRPGKDLYFATADTEYDLFLQIRKMRGTKHTRKILPLRITKEGLEILG